jgi:hypothetical protein
MGDPVFSDRVSKLLQEQFLTYGTQLTPVQQAAWPEPEKQEEVPSGSEMTNVTDGSATKLGEPRQDLAAQNAGNVGGLNPEAMGEVSSLLISIGYILSKEGIVPDKFNMQAIAKFLGDNFSQVCAPTAEAPPEGGVPPVAIEEPQKPDMMAPYMESRKLLESRFKK